MGGGQGKLTPKEMQEMTMNMKIQSRMMNKSAARCDKTSGKEKMKVKAAMEKGNAEGARLYAENAIREKNQAMSHRRLAARLDAVASKLESCSNSMRVPSPIPNTHTSNDPSLAGGAQF